MDENIKAKILHEAEARAERLRLIQETIAGKAPKPPIPKPKRTESE